MKKYTVKQIREGFRAWEQRRRSYPENFMTCYAEFAQGLDENATKCAKTLVKYIEEASA